LRKKRLAAFFIASALHQDVEDILILIDRSPEGVFFSTDSEYDLVQMPCVAATRTVTTQFIRVGLPEFEVLLPYGFVGHNDPALCEQFLNIAITQREAEREPDSVTDNLRREAEPFVIGSRDVCFHAVSMPEVLLVGKLTIPQGLFLNAGPIRLVR
jgi:hypothetical protein